MRIWLALIGAVLVQPLVFLLRLIPTFISADGPLYGLEFVLLSVVVMGTVAVLILGLPVFLWLKRSSRDSWTSLTIAGIVLGALPAALMWPRHLEGYSAGQNWHGNPVDTYVNGVPTNFAWLMYGEQILYFSLHGLVGALVFYAVWRKLERFHVTINTADSSADHI